MYTLEYVSGYDVGGSKTLLAYFPWRSLIYEHKIATNRVYEAFCRPGRCPKRNFKTTRYPMLLRCSRKIDRKNVTTLHLGNLNCRRWAFKKITENIGAPLVIEMTVLSGLYEAMLFHNRYKKVLYLTIGTGIGDGISYMVRLI